MKTGTVVFGLAALLVPGFAFAADASVVIREVEAKYSSVKAIKASFVQVTRSSVYGDEEQAGNVVLKRPKKMRWDFTSGGKKQFVSDGNTMWVYTADANQVIRYDNVGESSQADALLQSLDRLDEVFKVDLVDDQNAPGHVLSLQPKKQGQVKGLRLELDGGLLMKRVVITDQYDNVTELRFSDVKLNAEVPDSAFNFKPPPGAEVITTGGKGRNK